MAAGGYVPDDIMIGIIRNRLQQGDSQKGFVMDGFPRTIPQAEALDSLLDELGRRFDAFVYLNVEPAELVPSAGRPYDLPDRPETYPPGTEKCPLDGAKLIQREDDKPEAVKKRIEVYLDKTLPLPRLLPGPGPGF